MKSSESLCRYLDYGFEVSKIFKSAQLSKLPLWTVRAILHWKAQSTQWVPQIWKHQHKAGWIVSECALERTHGIGSTLIFSLQNYFWCLKQYIFSYHQAKINLCFSFWYFIQIYILINFNNCSRNLDLIWIHQVYWINRRENKYVLCLCEEIKKTLYVVI